MEPLQILKDSVMNKIYYFRGEKVILDFDLALLYEVTTKVLKQSVRRNIERFPVDFMFELSAKEFANLRSQIVTSSWGGSRYRPMAFTEQGIAMLSGIINSPRAIETNIAIMRTFVALRRWMQSNKKLAVKIKKLENKYDKQFKIVFDVIRQLIKEETETRPIGFRISDSRKGN